MKNWKIILSMPIAMLGSQAFAENWISIGSNDKGESITIDKDSIRRGNDGLVYYSVDDQEDIAAEAADCQGRVYYLLSLDDYINGPRENKNWRDQGMAVKPDSVAEAVQQYVCANAG